MSENGATPDLIRDTLQPLVDHRETLAGELAELEAEVTSKKGEMKRIDRLLREGGLVEPPKKKTGRQAQPSWVSEEMLDHARDALAELPDGPFTIRDLTARMEVSEASVRNAVDGLRERRELRLLGNRVRPEDNRKVAHYEVVA